MSVTDGSFESPGVAAGSAASWSTANQVAAGTSVALLGVDIAAESFEQGWDSNEDSIFVFLLLHLGAAQFFGNAYENFEAGWDNDAGLKDDLDSLVTENATFDLGVGGGTFETFEQLWYAPRPALALDNSFWAPAINNWLEAESVGPYVIVLNENDGYQFRIRNGETASDISLTVPPSAGYTATALAAILEAGINAALTADAGPAVAADVTVSNTDGKLRVTMNGAAPFGYLELIDSDNSLWPYLGLPTGRMSWRLAETAAIEATVVTTDSGPAAVEAFESMWRNNEDSLFSLSGGDIEAFDVGGAVETFESGWTTLLT